MQHRHVMETVDRSLRDIRNCEQEPFGGLPVAWGGDFQQTLPVVPHGRKEDIVAACIQKSHLWQHVHVMHLTHNMRVEHNAPESLRFAQWLLDVGSGKDLPIDHKMNIPAHMLTCTNIDELISQVYPGIEHGNTLLPQFFLERAILAARNDEVFQLNKKILEKFPGRLRTFHSVDKVVSTQENAGYAQHYPLEFLNSIEMGGLPPSHLELKQGVPLMLLRNLDPSEGLCNGTRLMLLTASNRLLHVRILTGPRANNTAFIPRITLNTNDEELPFTLSRRQFPVRLAFGMTINKAQGQSLQTVGINLMTPVFSHGQFYVAVSRATNWHRVFILLGEGTEGKTENIVYPDVLLTP
jgi:predicted alpha/beta hydrolase family esterase